MNIKSLLIIQFVFFLSLSLVAQVNRNNANRFRLAQSYEQSGDYQRAKAIYKELLNLQPWNSQYTEALNKVYLHLKEYDQSIHLLQSKLNKSPQDVSSYATLGTTYYIMGNREKAYGIWDKGIQIKPSSRVNYKIISNAAIENRAFDKAIEILNKGKTVSGEPKLFSPELARIYSMMMKFKEAADEYCSLLKQEPPQVALVKSRINVFINSPGAIEQTIDVVENYVFRDGDDAFLDLLSYLYKQNRMYDKAFEYIVKLDEQSGKKGALIYNFAQETFREKQYGESADAYNFVIDEYPVSPFTPTAKIGYARALEASLDMKYNDESVLWKPFYLADTTGAFEYESIVSAYAELLKLYQNNEIENEANYRIGLIRLNKFNDITTADSLFKYVALKSPLSEFAILSNKKLGEISIQKNELDKAVIYYQKIINSGRSSQSAKNEARLMLGKISYWNGEFTESLNILSNISKNLSDNNTNDAIELSVILNTFKRIP